jgi:two-component system, LuxR family, sensor kinase FixL
MNADLLARFHDLQAYVGWTEEDAARVRQAAKPVRRHMPQLVDDFYAELQCHQETYRIVTGGSEQIERLKATLTSWLSESLDCLADDEYVARRWQIGRRHAEIGLNPAYTAAAMSRLRTGLISLVSDGAHGSFSDVRQLVHSLNKLLDIELAVIQDAYAAEYTNRERDAERQRSDVRFRMLVEAAACLVAILRPDDADARSFRVVYFSPYSEDLTGFTASEIDGSDFASKLIPVWARERVSEELAATLNRRPTTSQEMPIVRRDGGERWIVWNARRLDDYDGGPAVLVVGQDFTERRDAQQRLFRAERLAGIGQMITGLAHESRNALQRIQSCSEMLELEVEGNDEGLRLVRRLQEAQDNLLRLFDEVRGYAAPIQLERAVCRIDTVWREAWNLLETVRRGRDASLVEHVGETDPTVEVDRFRLVQLFRNMLENALAACDDPVVVRIKCRDVQLAGHPALEISVRDNGPGLTADARRNVFEPFFTTKTRGTGLGMAIARRIIDAHGGRIAVGDDGTAGAEFIITLPRNHS